MTAAGTAATTAVAVPAYAAACEGGSGVTVVVDFASLGGGTSTGCAAGDPESGLAALRGAGHEPTRAAQQPGYFVCRIDGKPANDPCQRTSPANAYWSYWHAQPGGTWTFSNTGAADYDPAPGTVEGWAFGDGKPPSTPPPRAAEPAPTRSPTAEPAPQPAPARTTSAPVAAAGPKPAQAPTPAAASGSPSAAAAPSGSARTSAPATAAAGASPTQASAATPSEDVSAAQDEAQDQPYGVIVTLALLGLLAAAGAGQAFLRRRADGAA